MFKLSSICLLAEVMLIPKELNEHVGFILIDGFVYHNLGLDLKIICLDKKRCW